MTGGGSYIQSECHEYIERGERESFEREVVSEVHIFLLPRHIAIYIYCHY